MDKINAEYGQEAQSISLSSVEQKWALTQWGNLGFTRGWPLCCAHITGWDGITYMTCVVFLTTYFYSLLQQFYCYFYDLIDLQITFETDKHRGTFKQDHWLEISPLTTIHSFQKEGPLVVNQRGRDFTSLSVSWQRRWESHENRLSIQSI